MSLVVEDLFPVGSSSFKRQQATAPRRSSSSSNNEGDLGSDLTRPYRILWSLLRWSFIRWSWCHFAVGARLDVCRWDVSIPPMAAIVLQFFIIARFAPVMRTGLPLGIGIKSLFGKRGCEKKKKRSTVLIKKKISNLFFKIFYSLSLEIKLWKKKSQNKFLCICIVWFR